LLPLRTAWLSDGQLVIISSRPRTGGSCAARPKGPWSSTRTSVSHRTWSLHVLTRRYRSRQDALQQAGVAADIRAAIGHFGDGELAGEQCEDEVRFACSTMPGAAAVPGRVLTEPADTLMTRGLPAVRSSIGAGGPPGSRSRRSDDAKRSRTSSPSARGQVQRLRRFHIDATDVLVGVLAVGHDVLAVRHTLTSITLSVTVDHAADCQPVRRSRRYGAKTISRGAPSILMTLLTVPLPGGMTVTLPAVPGPPFGLPR
jgi:hypothetical protein